MSYDAPVRLIIGWGNRFYYNPAKAPPTYPDLIKGKLAVERVVGIGGIFFKARDPQALAAWLGQRS